VRSGNTNVNSLLQERKIRTLAENAFELFEKGETSIEEVYPILLNN
jgi:general secretion pathway protein E/type IV pilus assembly protein PilB